MTRSRGAGNGAKRDSAGKPRGKRNPLRRAAKRTPRLASPAADQSAKIKALNRELAEAREQQTATSEVLKVISRSPGDLEPVFQAMLENATRICEAKLGIMFRFENGIARPVAMLGAPPAFARFLRSEIRPGPQTALRRAAKSKKPLHIHDMRLEEGYLAGEPIMVAGVELGGMRTLLNVPMLKDGHAIGAIGIYRTEVRPFADKQIELLQAFAAQAVIAIENARLLSELRESLEQQTASAEVLRLVSTSQGEVGDVFQAILANAVRRCGSDYGALWLREGDSFRSAAFHGDLPRRYTDAAQWRVGKLINPSPELPIAQAARTGKPFQIPDLSSSQIYRDGHPLTVSAVDVAGILAILAVPLLQDETPIGAIVIYRKERGSFGDKQIGLVQNFAAQAVIAVQNARLLNELRESLQQQTATADVLGVISRSTFDLQTVLDTLAESAVRLCAADRSVIRRRVGDTYPVAATCGFSAKQRAYRDGSSTTPDAGSIHGRALVERRTVHIPDVLADPAYRQAEAALGTSAVRAGVGVPLMREGNVVGVLTVIRNEAVAFSQKQIELLETFADQAVIAIENVRLFEAEQQRTRELTESLEQQTATSEVLKVISTSPGQVEPVFEAMLASAVRICRASFGVLFRYGDAAWTAAAMFNVPAAFADYWQGGPQRPGPRTALGRVAVTKETVHISDVTQEPAYLEGEPVFVAAVNLGRFRTILNIPVLRDNELLGCFAIYRQEVLPFSDKQIALVQSFAAQAVIAIENTRLLNELRQRTGDLSEALEQQTATSEVLKVISRSPGDLDPVFQAMLQNAMSICEAEFGQMFLTENDTVRLVAHLGVPAELAQSDLGRGSFRPASGGPLEQVLRTRELVHVPDMLPLYREYPPVKLGGARSFLAVPMRKDGETIGAITIYRQQVRPFNDKQIALIENFAAQAVIAIENTRLLNELRQRTAELSQRTDDLSESLEQQTATSEVLSVISSSPGDLGPVFQAMLENACRICDARFGTLFRYENGQFRRAAGFGTPAKLVEFQEKRGAFTPSGTTLMQVAATKMVSHSVDEQTDPSPGPTATLGGARSVVGVPMLKDDEMVGAIVIYRQEVRPFTEKQIELVKNFAAQAVIAIENTRLLNELRQRTDDLTEALEQQTATSQVLKVISSSPGDLAPVFQTMLENAVRICEANFGVLNRHEDGGLRVGAMHNVPVAFAEFLTDQDGPYHPVPGSILDRVLQTKQVSHTADNAGELIGRAATLGGARSTVCVPMLKDDVLLGTITIYRQEVRPFNDKQIELVQNFANQAVIAIENTRLLNELRQRTDDLSESLEQQTATSEVLKVISGSPGNLQPVFDAMLENATRICEAQFGVMYRYAKGLFTRVAAFGAPPALEEHYRKTGTFKAGPGTGLDSVMRTKEAIRKADASVEPNPGAPAIFGGARSLGCVPMLKDDELIGAITIYRQEVRPFSDKQIELVQSFAAQAVIAIENARLLNELRDSLQQQMATADVLKVISRSTFDLKTVLDTLVDSAAHLCEAESAHIFRRTGEAYELAACRGYSREYEEFMRNYSLTPGRDSLVGRVALEGRIVHIPDVLADLEYNQPKAQALGRWRTMIGVPLLREGNPIGALTLTRFEVRPFSDKQIELLTIFADQAVIAIENVRLFEEVQDQKRELTESLKHQTATSEILAVISRSPTNAQPVFDAIAESAARLCEAVFTVVWLYDGKFLEYASSHNFTAEVLDQIKRSFPKPPDRSLAAGRAILDGKIAHVPDMLGDPTYAHDLALAGNWRASVAVPMLRDGRSVGAISVGKSEPGPFTERQMQLLTTFADQAVIAIENVRLFDEVQKRTEELAESLQQQTATAEVLKVISRSTFDLQTVLQTLVEAAARLSEADQGTIAREHGGTFMRAASHGFSDEFNALVRNLPVEQEAGSATGRALLLGRTVHIPDVEADPDYTFAAAQQLGGFRTILAVPMLRAGTAIGVLALTRKDVDPFTEKQIELVTTFADQAAIAIENVRLFESVEARTRELARSLEDLQTAQDRLVQTQKLASLGQLTAGIAHEIKNPLNFVNNFSAISTDLLDELRGTLQLRNYDDKIRSEIEDLMNTLQGNLQKIEQHGKRADSIVKNMLLHSREGSGEHRPVDINSVVEESLNLAYHGARAERQGFNITLERSFDPAAGEVDLFPQEITRVLLNLISNGFYAATKRKAEVGNQGGYEPTLMTSTRNLGDRVEIRIRDNGTGIPAEVKDKMFNPFFTTKPPGEGTGLGLSLSHDIIVKQHAGLIEVDTQPGQFTEFRIILPRTAASIAKTGGRA